ncbi:OmpA family protein [Lacinutrix sp. WUR7]|uniref:OmpA family protein n=1 Tax=Lacinutrix sp. WUR7 TaxID=2653681 RepID=UPI00193DBBD6|nr:OmpA family protein [Lacinutrix sp. WUR7]QRM88430.1 OmpA family protein [Lacinutrix sp. WUR7]
MKNIKIYITLLLLSSLSLTAQNKSTSTADKHFSRFDFNKAIESYQKLVEKGNADEYVYKRLAESNFNIFNTVEAEKWYAKALETSQDPETMINYVQMLKANGKYDKSNQWMTKFASMRPADVRAIAFNENPDYLPKILEKGKKFNVQNLEINSEVSDFGGTLKNGKLYITSARNNARREYGWNEQPFLDLYEFTVEDDGTYQNESLLGNDINTKYHEGVVAFSPDGNTMYFSRESFYEKQYQKDSLSNTRFSVLNLFKATKSGSDWSNVQPLPFNSNNYNTDHPSVSADGKTLYFTSDMPGGFGQGDIYKTTINSDGSFGEAKNLGQKINTEGREMFPFISDNGTLYLSSDGHLGLGGLDVFYTKEIDGKMSKIRNVGLPVNSNADDFAFSIDEESGEGFISSNREGGKGSDDIYAIKKLQPLCDVEITATVTDNKTGEILVGAMATLYDAKGNKIASKPTNAEGSAEFIIECDTETELEVTMDEYESNRLSIKGTDEEELAVAIALDPIEKLIVADRVELDPIYFDFDKSNITARAAFELDKLVQIMNKYPDMVINAKSHTDSRGPSSYNERLSNRRAQTTVQYVISKGIDAARISGVGKGESEPAVNCGTGCTEEEHQLNRRSEFIIVSGGPNNQ